MFIGLLRIAVGVAAVVSGTRAWLKIEGEHDFSRLGGWIRARDVRPVLNRFASFCYIIEGNAITQ